MVDLARGGSIVLAFSVCRRNIWWHRDCKRFAVSEGDGAGLLFLESSMPPPSKIGPPVVASCIDVSSSFFDGLAPILAQLEADQLEGPNLATRRCNSDAQKSVQVVREEP